MAISQFGCLPIDIATLTPLLHKFNDPNSCQDEFCFSLPAFPVSKLASVFPKFPQASAATDPFPLTITFSLFPLFFLSAETSDAVLPPDQIHSRIWPDEDSPPLFIAN